MSGSTLGLVSGTAQSDIRQSAVDNRSTTTDFRQRGVGCRPMNWLSIVDCCRDVDCRQSNVAQCLPPSLPFPLARAVAVGIRLAAPEWIAGIRPFLCYGLTHGPSAFGAFRGVAFGNGLVASLKPHLRQMLGEAALLAEVFADFLYLPVPSESFL